MTRLEDNFRESKMIDNIIDCRIRLRLLLPWLSTAELPNKQTNSFSAWYDKRNPTKHVHNMEIYFRGDKHVPGKPQKDLLIIYWWI